MKKYITTLVCLVVLGGTALAGSDNKKVVILPEDCNFRDSEFQIDAFGLGAFYNEGRPGWGGGLGANYFFGRYFGLGVEQDLFGRNDEGSSGYTEWGTFGNAFLRYPICSWNIAPYAVVGGGVVYGKKVAGGGTVGGGLEWRWDRNISFFADARWLYTEENSAVMARTGIKFAF